MSRLDRGVASQLDCSTREPLLSRGLAAPRNQRINGGAEVAIVHGTKNGQQVVRLALGCEGRRHRATRSNAVAVLVDVFADNLRGRPLPFHHVADEGLLHDPGRVEEHVVDASVQDSSLLDMRHHMPRVVRYRQQHRAVVSKGQTPFKRLSCSFMDKELWMPRGELNLEIRVALVGIRTAACDTRGTSECNGGRPPRVIRPRGGSGKGKTTCPVTSKPPPLGVFVGWHLVKLAHGTH